jgi:bacterioferritin-associated ferredoxin
MYVCICRRVTDRAIRSAAAVGARSVDDLKRMLELGTGCGSCCERAHACLIEFVADDAPARAGHPSPTRCPASDPPAARA